MYLRSGVELCSSAIMPCRTSVTGKHWPWLCVRDLGQTAINKHHVSITHRLHVSCFLFVLRRQPPRCHGECPNNVEDTQRRRDPITEVGRGKKKKGGSLYHMEAQGVFYMCVSAERNDRNAQPSALALSEGWVGRSTGAESFPGTSLTLVWARKIKEIQCAFPFVVLYLLQLAFDKVINKILVIWVGNVNT